MAQSVSVCLSQTPFHSISQERLGDGGSTCGTDSLVLGRWALGVAAVVVHVVRDVAEEVVADCRIGIGSELGLGLGQCCFQSVGGGFVRRNPILLWVRPVHWHVY